MSGSARDALLFRTQAFSRAIAVVDTRVAELMEPTHRLIATSIESAIQIVTTRVHINAITGRSVTALTSFTPKVASTSTVFFEFAPPEQPIATRRGVPRTISIGHAAWSVIRLAGERLRVATSVAPPTVKVLRTRHRQALVQSISANTASQMQFTVLFTCTASIRARLTTALLTNEPDRAIACLFTTLSHTDAAMTNTITGAIIRHET